MLTFASERLPLLAVAIVFALPAPALATPQRTFVASHGNDTDACSITAPCRSFAAAIAQTIAGGEVIVLDSAGYGPVTITKSVAMVAPPGIYAGIFVASGNGIVINTPAVKVKLEGLTLNGQGGERGIEFTDGDQLHVERCTVRTMAGIGIYIAGATRHATIVDSRLESNGSYGVYAADGASVAIDRLVASDHGTLGGGAIIAAASIDGLVTRMTIANSTFARNNVAIYAYSPTGLGYVRLAARGNTILGNAGNQWGILVQCATPCATPNQLVVTSEANSISSASYGIEAYSTNTAVIVSDSGVTQNSIGFINSGGKFVSMGNNMVELNLTDTVGAITGGTLR